MDERTSNEPEFKPAVNAGELQAEQTMEQRTIGAFRAGESNYWAGFDRPGHEGEYIVNVRGYDHDNYIPDEIVDSIKALIGSGWDVENRGSRIEIFAYPDESGKGRHRPDDELVGRILDEVIDGKVESQD